MTTVATPLIEGRHEKMIAAAVWLAGQGFADIGWAPTSDGKAPVRHWKSDVTDDPALVPDRLHGARNALVIPKGHGLVIDADDPRAWAELEAAGLPETFRVDSPTPGHGHAYAWADADMSTIPGSFEWGEIRRSTSDARTSSMVLGPYALRSDGVYGPHNGCRTIATLPASVVDYLGESSRRKSLTHTTAKAPTDPGWYIEHGRHDWLVNRARNLRGIGLSAERLYDELVRIDQERNRPPLADVPGRGLEEVRRIASWTEEHIEDDEPGVTLVTTPKAQPADTAGGIDAAELLELTLEPLRMIVPDLIPEGTTVLAAPPKVGKSCLVYQIVVEVAIGGELFGQRVTPGSCLYLALEDGRRRGQDRLRAALAGRTLPHGRLEIRWSSRRIGEGLEEDLTAWLDAHPDAAVVAIDTLQRVRARTNGKRGQYELDVEDLGRLQALFRDRRVALIIVHHSRKETGDDFLASVSGTYGITGSADTTVVIRRKRLEAFGTIVATGRDIAEAEIPVRFDGLLWHEAPAVVAEASFERAEVYSAIVARGPIFPAAIAEALGLERTSVQHMVAKLVDRGAVARTAKGYVVAGIGASRAPAYTHNPDHSRHSDSEHSDQGHVRGESEPIPFFRPADVSSTPDDDVIACDDYLEHQLQHRRVAGRGWVCAVCHPGLMA